MSHQYALRMVYENARAAINAASLAAGGPGNAADNAVLSQSFLTLEQIATVANNSYKFPILNNEGAPRPTERRLTLQDAFYVSQVQFLLSVTPLATDTAYKRYAYPSPAIFTTAGAELAMYNLYNGYMTLAINNSTIIPAWDMGAHLKANQTQQPVGATFPIDQFDGGLDGAFPTQPNFVLIGSKGSNLGITLPAAISTLQAANVTILAFRLRGVLAQNVTVVS
jgi:hypothetical protein